LHSEVLTRLFVVVTVLGELSPLQPPVDLVGGRGAAARASGTRNVVAARSGSDPGGRSDRSHHDLRTRQQLLAVPIAASRQAVPLSEAPTARARLAFMASDLAVALVSGCLALGGALSGVLLSNTFSRRTDRARLKAEDDRRWLTDRRSVYARFLGLSEAMLREIDGVAVFMSYDGTANDR
jgi:hypothetical protein